MCKKAPDCGKHCGSEASREDDWLSSNGPREAGRSEGEVITGDVKQEVTTEEHPSVLELPWGLFMSTEFFVRERKRGPFGNGGREGRSRTSEGRRGDSKSDVTRSIRRGPHTKLEPDGW